MAKTLRDITPSLSSRILINYQGTQTEFMVIAHDHHTQGGTTIFPVNTLDKLAFDAREPNNPDYLRPDYGNNNWKHSNLRQFLNTDQAGWFTKQHTYDQAPTSNYVDGNAYADKQGFLSRFDKEFVDHLMEVTIRTANAPVDGGGSYTTKDKVFLLSRRELFNEYEAGGQYITLFNSDTARKADTYYWTRSPYHEAYYSHWVYLVHLDGTLNTSAAYLGYYGVRPAFVLPSSTTVNNDGTLTFFPEFNMKIDGAMKTSENGWVKINGILKEIDSIYIKIDGTIKEV